MEFVKEHLVFNPADTHGDPHAFSALGVLSNLNAPALPPPLPLSHNSHGAPPAKGVRIAAAVGLALFAVIGFASIGWFYLPATVAAFMALSRPRENGTPQGLLRG